MTMESPVRICLGAALVVNLLLLASNARGNALPHEPTTTVKDERQPRLSRNSTWAPQPHKPIPDVALNELHPKESVSEDHTEKNAKYKHRGRVRFNSQIKSSTESNLRRSRTSSTSKSTTTLAPKPSSEAAKLVIVTPTPEVKKPAQIIDSMRNFKRTKMPVSSSSTTSSSPESVELDTEEEEEEYEDDADKDEEDDVQDDKDKFKKYLSSTFPDSNFFTIPSYNEDFSHDSDSADNKLKSHYKKSHDTFSSYFPDISYGPSTKDDVYKAESFFDFDSELTTPKNDFFDKKFEEISKGIMKNLETSKTKVSQPNETTYKVIKGNTGVAKLTNGTPTNKSTVIIKNTKEIRLLDNEHAGSDPKALSDVHGTSIYYEMSVLSTETYNINHTNDDDCDNDTGPEPTVSTSADEELASVKTTQSSLATESTKASIVSSSPESISTLSSNYFPFSSPVPTYFSTVIPELTVYSTQGTRSEFDKTRTYSSSFSRNKNYSKRLNFNEVKDSNNLTPRGEQAISNQSIRQNTRKFAYTTPKTKPVWMSPRRNATRTSYTRTTTPRTIYSEHFSIKDKTTTNLPRQPSRTTLTTVSSEIDPVKQGDVSGVKKIVHSLSISDNSIPSLWKRGSTKYASSTATSTEVEGSGISDLEIPPTLTAWALASLRSPPHQPSGMANASTSTHKTVDENELQKVGEFTEKNEITTSSAVTKTTASSINNDVLPKITEIVQNRLPWRPVATSKVVTEKSSETSGSENKFESLSDSENKSESLPAESNISLQSSIKPASATEEINTEVTEASAAFDSPETTEIESKDSEKSWVSATEESKEQEETSNENLKVIPPVDATKSTGFESITKLPAGITTPQGETITSLENKSEAVTRLKEPTTTTEMPAPVTIPTTTDYEVTTIRFSYVPTEAETESSVKDTTMSSWHPVFPTRTKTTTIKDEPVTTYRPKYMTTTDSNEEITTTIPESLSQDTTSQKVDIITEISVKSNSNESTQSTSTSKSTDRPTTISKLASAETTENSQETTTIIVEVITEINTERESSKSSSSETSSETNETETPPSEIRESSSENSGSNEVITQDNKPVVTTPKPKTTTEEKTTQSKEELTTIKDTTTQSNVFSVTTVKEDSPQELETVKTVTETDEEMGLTSEATTETSRLGGPEEAGSGAAVAIAVSTIGVIALILLVGLLLVVRRRGRRGVYAQRCTPVSLDAYSLDSVSVGHRKGNHRLRASKRSYGNPAYDDEVTSHPMQYAALANFALDMESMTAEFSEIPSVTVKPDEVPPGCEDKNRYSNVLPLPETRVPLKRIGNDPTTEYINANYITGPGNIRNYYIACQAPLPNTVVDFWRMIWEQNSRVIVMLTEYMENGVEKCYEYLPPSEISDNRRIFGDFKIVLLKREQKDKYAISTVQLINTATRTWREVTHLWYFWPAKGVPDDYDSVIDFLTEMRSFMKISQTAKEYDEEGVEVIYGDQSRSSFHNVSKLRSDESASGNGVNVYSPARVEEQLKRGTNGTLGRMKTASEVEAVRPCVVVCASGAGRSAAIIAADVCARALAAAAADVPRVVRELRAQRPHSLSNRHHYIFLYKVLAEYGNKLMGGGVDTI